MIPFDDLRPGLFVAIRYARPAPASDQWTHVPNPRVWRVLGVSAPYVGLEDLATGHRHAFDGAAYEFEHLRPEFVRAIFPEQFPATAAAAQETETRPEPRPRRAPAQELGADGFPKPVRLMTINPYGRRQR